MIDLYLKVGAALITAIATIWGLYKTAEGVRDIYLQTFPEIEVVGSDESSPTALPISISNPSSWFTMSDIHRSTVIVQMKSGGLNMSNIGTDMGDLTDIDPKSHKIFNWPIRIDAGIPVASMTVLVTMTYKVFYFTRTKTETFNWYAKRWVKGEHAS